MLYRFLNRTVLLRLTVKNQDVEKPSIDMKIPNDEEKMT